LLVYALSRPTRRWRPARRWASSAPRAALFALFIVVELRSRAPIIAVLDLPNPRRDRSNVAGLALGGAVFGMIFILTLYMQQVLGYSALRTGLAWLAMSLTALISSVICSVLVTRVGPRLPLAGGLVIATGGLLWLAQIPAAGSYASDLLAAAAGSGHRARRGVRRALHRPRSRACGPRRRPGVGAREHHAAGGRRARRGGALDPRFSRSDDLIAGGLRSRSP